MVQNNSLCAPALWEGHTSICMHMFNASVVYLRKAIDFYGWLCKASIASKKGKSTKKLFTLHPLWNNSSLNFTRSWVFFFYLSISSVHLLCIFFTIRKSGVHELQRQCKSKTENHCLQTLRMNYFMAVAATEVSKGLF